MLLELLRAKQVNSYQVIEKVPKETLRMFSD